MSRKTSTEQGAGVLATVAVLAVVLGGVYLIAHLIVAMGRSGLFGWLGPALTLAVVLWMAWCIWESIMG